MRDIEIQIGQQIIWSDCLIECVEGGKCENCFVHKETKYDTFATYERDWYGGDRPVSVTNQCGSDYGGNTQGFICYKNERHDGKDVSFKLIERLEPIENDEE
jgi:hypothetical protein